MLCPPSTSLSLLGRLRTLQPHAWQSFSTAYTPLLRGVAARWGLREHDVDDFVQDCMVSLVVSLPTFVYDQSKGSFRSWLRQCALNKLIDRARAKSRRITIGGAGGTSSTPLVARAADTSMTPDSIVEKGEECAFLIDQLMSDHRIEERDRELFLMKLAEMSNSDIARALSVTEGTVRTRWSRLVKTLKEIGEAIFDEDAGESEQDVSLDRIPPQVRELLSPAERQFWLAQQHLIDGAASAGGAVSNADIASALKILFGEDAPKTTSGNLRKLRCGMNKKLGRGGE